MNGTDILNFKGAGHEDRRVIRLYRTEGEKTGQDRRTDTFGDVCTKTHIHIYSYTHFTGTLNIQIRSYTLHIFITGTFKSPPLALEKNSFY